jgi:hypothetical protein
MKPYSLWSFGSEKALADTFESQEMLNTEQFCDDIDNQLLDFTLKKQESYDDDAFRGKPVFADDQHVEYYSKKNMHKSTEEHTCFISLFFFFLFFFFSFIKNNKEDRMNKVSRK